jgi:hypothetical protein
VLGNRWISTRSLPVQRTHLTNQSIILLLSPPPTSTRRCHPLSQRTGRRQRLRSDGSFVPCASALPPCSKRSLFSAFPLTLPCPPNDRWDDDDDDDDLLLLLAYIPVRVLEHRPAVLLQKDLIEQSRRRILGRRRGLGASSWQAHCSPGLDLPRGISVLSLDNLGATYSARHAVGLSHRRSSSWDKAFRAHTTIARCGASAVRQGRSTTSRSPAGSGPTVARLRLLVTKLAVRPGMLLPVRPGQGSHRARIPIDVPRLAPSTHPADDVRSGCLSAIIRRAERRGDGSLSFWQKPRPVIPSGSLRAPIPRTSSAHAAQFRGNIPTSTPNNGSLT